jgi:hypothetical protein
MENFPKPSRAQLDAAFPYERLTITGKIRDALWHPLWLRRLAADDDAKEDNKLVARDLTRARRKATALAVVDDWNKDPTQPVPVFSVVDGGSRRCAFVAIDDGESGGWRADDRSTFEPLTDAVAAAGGLLVNLNSAHRDVGLDLVLVSPHTELGKTGDSQVDLKLNGRVVFGNARNWFWAALAEQGDDDDDDDTEEAPSAARRPRRGAAAAPVAPPKPVKSPQEIADLPCFVRDALEMGRPVLDDDAESFRAHYSCFERNRTDPNDKRKIKFQGRRTGKTAHQVHGEFYPPDYNQAPGGFSRKDPPMGSYDA